MEGEREFWDAVFCVAFLASIAGGNKTPDAIEDATIDATLTADRALNLRRLHLGSLLQEPEPTEPAKAKRAPSTRLPCPGGGARRLGGGDAKCANCGRVVGSLKDHAGWYVAEHKLPAETKR